MDAGIKKILEAGIAAPSGENSQPWLFKITGSQVDVLNNPQRDTSLYNYNQRSHLVSHGCLIENILIAAKALGYTAHFNLFPEGVLSPLISRFVFSAGKNGENEENLFPYIQQRSTNRKPYKKTSLLHEHRKEILASVAAFGNIGLKLTEDRDALRQLAAVGALNERIVFENKELHRFLYSHLTWTAEEDAKNHGFYLKTLELPRPVEMVFKVFRSWPLVRQLNNIGFSRLIQKGNKDIYQAASAMGILTCKGRGAMDYIMIGRALQRVWLTTTRLGLAFQPLTGVLFFMQAIADDAPHGFTKAQIVDVENHYRLVKNIFNISEEYIPIMFRIGYGEPPSARTSRYSPEKFILT